MKLNYFQSTAEYFIEELQNLINKLPIKGNTADECQRITLQIALNNLNAAVNGTTQADMPN